MPTARQFSPCLTVEPVSCGAFLFPALADGGNRLLAFAFSPRLPVSATLAGLFEVMA
jgi:hypothetical protein